MTHEDLLISFLYRPTRMPTRDKLDKNYSYSRFRSQ